jgi:RNase P subunit RPR2
MSWWKRKKCGTCKKVLKKKNSSHELRLQTADGMLEVEICDKCARFWDASAEVLTKGRKKDDGHDG